MVNCFKGEGFTSVSPLPHGLQVGHTGIKKELSKAARTSEASPTGLYAFSVLPTDLNLGLIYLDWFSASFWRLIESTITGY